MNTYSLDTTQNIAIEYPLAGIGDRVLATLIDGLIVAAYYFIILFLFGTMASYYNGGDNGGWIMLIIFMLPLMFYNLACEIWMDGQTFGKRAMKIRVMGMKGGSASYAQYFVRWLMRLVDIYIGWGVAAFVCVIATDKNQRLGDLAAGTIVVKTNVRAGVETSIEQLQTVKPDYIPKNPEAAHLDYADIRLVHDVINAVNKTNNTMLALELANKIEQKTGAKRGQEEPIAFLYSVLTDYQNMH
ncbi:MAG: RDD family protein [Chitinophagaceae bacterium]